MLTASGSSAKSPKAWEKVVAVTRAAGAADALAFAVEMAAAVDGNIAVDCDVVDTGAARGGGFLRA